MLPEALVLIDRHYNSLLPYRPNRPNLYAVRHGSHLTLRYAEFQSSRLILRPHNIAFPVELISHGSGRVAQRLAGRKDCADSERDLRFSVSVQCNGVMSADVPA